MEIWGKRTLDELLLSNDSGTWGEVGTFEDGFPILRSTNISNWTLDLNGDLAYRKISDNLVEKFSLLKGDIIVTKSSGSPGLIGQAALFDIEPSRTFLFSNFTQRLRPNQDLVVPTYLHAYLRSPQARRVIEEMHRTTSGLRNLKLSDYLSQEIPIPYPDDPARSLAEQRRIVARLEALLSEVRALRDLLQSMRRDWSALMESALAEVFPSHGQALPEGWEWVKVDKVAEDTTRRNPESEPDKPFQYIDIAAVDNQEFTIVPERVKTLLGQDAPSRARKVIHAQNIILATTRPYLKNAALVTEQFDNQICSTGFCVLCPIPEKIDYRYLYHSVKADSFIKQLIPLQRGANYPAVSDSDVFACEIPVPYPDDPARSLAEQRRIVAYLEAVQEEVSAARRQVEEDERRVTQLEQSILAAAFRGEV
jgi:type I restriction enzyme S subunit